MAMKTSTFIEFSCWITGTDQGKLGDHQLLLDELTTGFWPATKVRNQRWNKVLDEIEPLLPLAKPNDDCWCRFQRVSDEVLLSETLSRVWFAAIISKTADADNIDIAQCIIPDHVKTRKRALLMWDHAPDSVLEFARRANTVQTLRNQVNDLLLSQVSEEVVGRNLSIFLRHNLTGFFPADTTMLRTYSRKPTRSCPHRLLKKSTNSNLLNVTTWI